MHESTVKKYLIVTGQHFATSPRKVSLHFVAENLREAGNTVDFVTCRLSWLNRASGDRRWEFAKNRACNRWVSLAPNMSEYIWTNIVHPVNFRSDVVNRLTIPFCKFYGKLLPRDVIERLKDYDTIIIETGLAVLLVPEIRIHAPSARLIYHGADRLETISGHPYIQTALLQATRYFDAIHVAASDIACDFPPDTPIKVVEHGLSKSLFDQASRSPYGSCKNAVNVGDSWFDPDVVAILAEAFPDYTFHLFGRYARINKSVPNVVVHGEVSFETIVPYVKFADVGLSALRAAPNAAYLSQSSNKMIQYTYCKLPIVAPAFVAAGRRHVCAYDTEDLATAVSAFEQASLFDRACIDNTKIRSWKEVVGAFFLEYPRR